MDVATLCQLEYQKDDGTVHTICPPVLGYLLTLCCFVYFFKFNSIDTENGIDTFTREDYTSFAISPLNDDNLKHPNVPIIIAGITVDDTCILITQPMQIPNDNYI